MKYISYDEDEKNTDHNCRVCGSIIVERSVIPYIPAFSADAIGPGSKNIATEKDREITGWHCSGCGIEYRKLPLQ